MSELEKNSETEEELSKDKILIEDYESKIKKNIDLWRRKYKIKKK